MRKKSIKVKKRIIRKDSENKIEAVMREFKNGTLKDSHGKTVTDRSQAVAIGLSEAGMSDKSLLKAEMSSKLTVLKEFLNNAIEKEQARAAIVETRVIEFFKIHKDPSDKDIHDLADKLRIDPSDLENMIYSIVSSIFTEGRSYGRTDTFPEDKIQEGMQIESEHTSNPHIQRKIAEDHLAESLDYYDKLKKVEGE